MLFDSNQPENVLRVGDDLPPSRRVQVAPNKRKNENSANWDIENEESSSSFTNLTNEILKCDGGARQRMGLAGDYDDVTVLIIDSVFSALNK